MVWDYMVDSHIHTSNSVDAPVTSTTENMVKQGIDIGLKMMTITDHCEVNRFGTNDSAWPRVERSFNDAKAMAQKYHGQIEVLAGVELGQAPQGFELAEKIIDRFDFEFVIGSIHNARCPQDFSEMDFSDPSIDIDSMMEVYFNELYALTKWNKTDTLAHITYPHRYITGKYGIPVNMDKYWDILDATYKNLIHNGKALEINTSGLRQEIGATLPSKEYVQRFKDLGGELVTIGADAHMPRDLGTGIADGYALAKECGFKYVCYFKGRKPQMIKL